jgi:hypothetical protein
MFINYLGREEALLDAVAPEQPHESSDPLEPEDPGGLPVTLPSRRPR